MAVSLHLWLLVLLVVGWCLNRLATAEHPSQPPPQPTRGEGLVDLAVRLRVSGLVSVVVRSFGPDHSTHTSTLAWRRRDYQSVDGDRELGQEGRPGGAARLDPDAAAHPFEQLATDV
jgi:hypothetical protein